MNEDVMLAEIIEAIADCESVNNRSSRLEDRMRAALGNYSDELPERLRTRIDLFFFQRSLGKQALWVTLQGLCIIVSTH